MGKAGAAAVGDVSVDPAVMMIKRSDWGFKGKGDDLSGWHAH